MEVQTSGKPIDQLLEKVLCMNILSSDYFKELYRLKTYHEVIDEIYNQVDHVEPWMTGNCRGPSTSFCLLYKFFTMKLTVKQMHGLLKHQDSPYIRFIDEIYNQVDHVEPWMTGNCRGPSTSFCLLYKFFTMKLTVKQMHGLLKHQDSPYIRCVGFLYLRYAADPKTLWNWFEPYVKDEEMVCLSSFSPNVKFKIFKDASSSGLGSSSSTKAAHEFSPGSSGQVTTMGVYVRDLLLGQMELVRKKMELPTFVHEARAELLQSGLLLQYYFDTLFPRIPVPVMRQIVSNLEKMNLPTKHCGVTGESTRGSDDTARRPPSVKAALSVSFGQRAPHRASTRDSSPVRRTMAPPSYDRNGKDDYSRRSPSNRRSQSHDLSDQDYPDRDQDQDRDREWDRNRDRDRGRDSDRKGDRVRERERDRDRGQERDRDRRYDYERRSRESSRREYDKSSRDRRSRSRNRSRSQSNQSHSAHPNHHPSPHRDDNKEKTSASSNLAKLRDLYGDLSSQKEDSAKDRLPNRDSGAEEVIRLGGSKWK
ncbi:hypothetical protein TEA_000238 [Camellia sinensis var. sinensis]|uniref:Pre-mRNA-splicing factor 38 n=1 Tax=Camellia sinensis var. sinensis TaxID=542762 RepID=A0A4S4DS19_CAMSN|nr:hypothetical protein TEA_000238 [Camellia sinensis var. sinensis]